MTYAAKLHENAKQRGNTFVPKLFGFEFSLKQLEEYIDREAFKSNMIGRCGNLSKEEYKAASARFAGQDAHRVFKPLDIDTGG